MKSKNLTVLVITLESATERQETIAGRLKQLGMDYHFVPGVDGRLLDLEKHPNYAPARRRAFYGRDLSQGEFGCILAHRETYRHMLDQGIEQALVLEDDALLTDDLPRVIEALLQFSSEWDLVRFLGREKNYRSTKILMELPGCNTSLGRQTGIPGGAYGYLLNLRAAEKLFTMTRRSWLAIDTLHGATWLTGLQTLAVVPSPILPNDASPSCIDTQDNNLRWDKTVRLKGWMRLAYPVTRMAWKLYLGLCTRFMAIKCYLHDRRGFPQCPAEPR